MSNEQSKVTVGKLLSFSSAQNQGIVQVGSARLRLLWEARRVFVKIGDRVSLGSTPYVLLRGEMRDPIPVPRGDEKLVLRLLISDGGTTIVGWNYLEQYESMKGNIPPQGNPRNRRRRIQRVKSKQRKLLEMEGLGNRTEHT